MYFSMRPKIGLSQREGIKQKGDRKAGRDIKPPTMD